MFYNQFYISVEVCKRRYNVIFQVGGKMVTRGQRRLGRTIRTLRNSVELSTKENRARESEKKYKEKIEKDQNFDDSPVQDLRYLAKKKIRSAS